MTTIMTIGVLAGNHERAAGGVMTLQSAKTVGAMPPRQGNISDKVRALRKKNAAAGAAPCADASSEAGSAAADTEHAEASQHLVSR